MNKDTVVHLAVLQGVREPARLRERAEAFAAQVQQQLAGPTSLFVGDAVEKGQTVPDRRHDLSGEPLFVALTRLTVDDGGATEGAMQRAEAAFADGARRYDAWRLRERFTHVSPRAESLEPDAWM